MANSERVKKLASWLWWVVAVLVYALPVTYFIVIVILVQAPDWPQNVFPEASAGAQQGWVAASLVIALALVLVLPILHMLVEMRSLFGNYRRGEILTEASARHILGIGRAMLSLAVLKVVVPAIQLLLLTGDTLSFGLNDNFVIFMLAGGFLVTIGWAMREAAELAEENRGFV
ncbi:DUF2975 domain-containing protein [Frigidibacter sp. RF13]|uniref:DUF2975 domain-containing protein n=1 Tax=Frigidibacter sp. RF13 TaxID=2997340 RepID=UPI002271D02C|nr:DUF2975 domain-containing protein [Frigidibacter sp. RF13]MCY1128158.1 DUF2975 domain-containing protein [Frigidibacter sp. RF13]